MGLSLITPPAAEPVSIDAARDQCEEVGTHRDTMIGDFIATARQQAEHRTGRALVTQGLEYTLRKFPTSTPAGLRIPLPKPKLQSVQSVTYLDEEGVRQTLANTEYQVVTNELIGYILPAYGATWPVCRIQPNSVAINYTAGYGAADAVPQSIRSWILIATATLYGQREVIIDGFKVAEVPGDFFPGLLLSHTVEF